MLLEYNRYYYKLTIPVCSVNVTKQKPVFVSQTKIEITLALPNKLIQIIEFIIK